MHGLDNGAELAPGYEIMKNVIIAGCKLAVKVSKDL